MAEKSLAFDVGREYTQQVTTHRHFNYSLVSGNLAFHIPSVVHRPIALKGTHQNKDLSSSEFNVEHIIYK